MKSQMKNVHWAGVKGVLYFNITSSVVCIKIPAMRWAVITYSVGVIVDWWAKYSPDLEPNPDNVLNVSAVKNVINPTSISTARLDFWFSMVMVRRVHKRSYIFSTNLSNYIQYVHHSLNVRWADKETTQPVKVWYIVSSFMVLQWESVIFHCRK